MQVNPNDAEDNKPLRIRRGRVESVDLYEIKDSELDLFQQGSPADLQLNFAIFLLSVAFSAIVALSTATFENKTAQTTIIVVAVVGCFLGTYLLVAWTRNRKSLQEVCSRIRQRIKEPAVITSVSKSDFATIETIDTTDEPKDPEP